MTDSAWTWLLFGAEVVGVGGMFAVGRKHWWGWVIVLVHSIPWFVYALTHDKPGFVAMALMWWVLHAYNARRWLMEARRG